MEKKFNYVYLTTNLVNGNQYVGDRSCNCNPENDKYLGSGTYYKNAEKLYGKVNFNKQILECFDTREKAFNAQEKYIKQYNTLVPNGYNIDPVGGHGTYGGYLSEETKLKIGNSNKGKIHTEETKNLWKKQRKGKNNGMYGKGYLISKEKNGRYNEPVSSKTKEKISNSKKGKNTWMKGKNHSIKTKEQISKTKSKLSFEQKQEIFNSIKNRNTNQTIEDIIKILIIKFNVSRNTIYRAYNYIYSISSLSS